MPSITCDCGRPVEGPPGDAVCPGCGNILLLPEDRVRFACACGAPLSAPPGLAGRRVACPRCGAFAAVPKEEVEVPAPPPEAPRKRWARWALAAALIPLALSPLIHDDLEERVERMVKAKPELAPALEAGDFEALPDQRIEGALHGRDTWAHWLYAALAASGFWLFIRAFWPMGNATSGQLWFMGILVGTIGIFLLLAFQWVAFRLGGWIIPRGIVGLAFLIVKFIGYSYQAALDPANGFIPSLLGFTFGVGLCEELLKTLPLLILARRAAALDARGLALLGLATGIGFGVSEGITYSADMYNGLSGAWIYVVRFVSCVALHAVWSACSALLLYGLQAEIDGIDVWYEWPIPLLKLLGVSMVLHGLYDTFLKRDLEMLALLTAVASVAWFFWLYERVCGDERRSWSPA